MPRLPPFQFNAATRPVAQAPIAKTVEEALSIARTIVIQASSLATSSKEQSNILDLLEIFRDYTENNRLNKQGLSILASQVSNLEAVSKTIETRVRLLQKPVSSTATTSSTQPSSSTTTRTQTTSLPTSYATVAASNSPKETEWQKLVLTQEQEPLGFASLEIRNAFNLAFAKKGVKSPVIASATLSLRKNIVLTTTPTFTAKYLLKN
ncbi:uncharacterized protein M421DRAFT_400053 [Didymella exigua CBS 183.55]|uniref:Uncharacterized protein n=1 Tax=Didymella exigua CBS 183.55 TaxID=1150837 RepID=A0A6A5RDS1_9PLEO|nr:uncharacterized protein M421DRAFT_400053 [Didymella exigua CBS 183.55]KAF1925378.1 hypothetical protein M421DRAFT_400053 [Didymella exigua CBS 183.55]